MKFVLGSNSKSVKTSNAIKHWGKLTVELCFVLTLAEKTVTVSMRSPRDGPGDTRRRKVSFVWDF